MQQPFRLYHILVVEDNPGDVVLIREAFIESGKSCELVFVNNTESAKAELDRRAFDLIISDMGPYQEEGAEFIRWIRADGRLKSLPVIVLTGAASSRLAYEAGANAFIAKSADIETFVSKIKALAHFWVDVVELPRVPGAVPG